MWLMSGKNLKSCAKLCTFSVRNHTHEVVHWLVQSNTKIDGRRQKLSSLGRLMYFVSEPAMFEKGSHKEHLFYDLKDTVRDPYWRLLFDTISSILISIFLFLSLVVNFLQPSYTMESNYLPLFAAITSLTLDFIFFPQAENGILYYPLWFFGGHIGESMRALRCVLYWSPVCFFPVKGFHNAHVADLSSMGFRASVID